MTSQNFINKLINKRQATDAPDDSSVSLDKNIVSATDELMHKVQSDSSALVVPLDQIVEDAGQARKTFTDISTLAAQIEQHGQLQAVVVESIGQGQYRLLVGHRRFRAIQWLNEQQPGQYGTIKALLRDASSQLQRRLAQYSENTAREQYAPLDEAHELMLLKELLNCTQKELAQQVHKSESYVSKSLSLLKLSESQKDQLLCGELSKKQATEEKPLRGDNNIVESSSASVRRVTRVAIAMPALENVALLIQLLAEKLKLNCVRLSKKPTRKELIAIVENRVGDVLRAVRARQGGQG